MTDQPPAAPVIDATRPSAEVVDRVAGVLGAGGVVGLATDTVYGLAALATDADAVSTVFELKARPAELSMAVLVADLSQASTLVEMDPIGTPLAEAFWPGPLTIVARRRVGTPAAVGTRDTVGVRCPADDTVRAIATRVGPIAATSANRHGEPTPPTAIEVARLFPSLSLVLDGGPRPGTASSVVAVAAGRCEVLRAGPIGESQLRSVLERAGIR